VGDWSNVVIAPEGALDGASRLKTVLPGGRRNPGVVQRSARSRDRPGWFFSGGGDSCVVVQDAVHSRISVIFVWSGCWAGVLDGRGDAAVAGATPLLRRASFRRPAAARTLESRGFADRIPCWWLAGNYQIVSTGRLARKPPRKTDPAPGQFAIIKGATGEYSSHRQQPMGVGRE